MMARSCDACRLLITQKDDEYLELSVRVLDATESDTQDPRDSRYCDFCDGCIHSGAALAYLLKAVEWKLEPAATAKTTGDPQ